MDINKPTSSSTIEMIRLAIEKVHPTLSEDLNHVTWSLDTQLIDLGLSSVTFLELIGELEDKFDIAITQDQLTDVFTLEDVLNLVNNQSD